MSTPPHSATGVPLTQNTAPVVKHRCLYTHDLRRKAKRWQDGFLRYHTFNKRIMVYDTAGNFVGDQHGRHEEGIHDGDELELDRGVLVQVCESMERTETDLSGLYSNKKTQQSPRAGPGHSIVPSMRPGTPVRSSLSSQQPRSLNDLLGIRKTPVTRLMSPYEQRHWSRENARDLSPPSTPAPDRPAKRVKATPKNPRDQTRPQPVVIDLCEPSGNPPAPTSATSASVRGSDPPRDDPRPPTTKNTRTEPKTKNITIPPRPAPPPSPPSAPPTAKSNPPEAPLNTLRISTDRPRKKLLYQALLPKQAATTTPLPATKTTSESQAAHPNVPPTSTNPDFVPSSSTLSLLDEMVNSPASRPAARVNPATRSTGLRKALSDPTTLTMRDHAFGGPLQEDTPGEQGPWTAEAMDLFDFWPPGREKPV
ncbi:hypothetical protein BDW42DRAFT_172150 [Aspergillus taichungensis]|uniref:5'-3' DNA helicase ZGRF1-like N-terminal domain-containing protein n=1 Tax=Aspergillus taichungensis TaxID=482145 RepID=A0A2J5HR83_9EURO|nr:hypothetical protein BDW42DRAFT_172150 [Aspergillus taichungensis]